MAIEDDFSVAINGDIRYTGSGATYTVLEFHRYLQNLADDAQATGDDLVDITSETPSDRATDQILTLNSPYNIDDTAARYLYDGSITQSGGNTRYSGAQFVGTVASGTEIMIVQDGKVLPPYWGTGINAVPTSQLIMQLLIKSKQDGALIDGGRILGLVREFGDTWAEFPATLGLANSVVALSSSGDLNNTTIATTVRGWTTISFTEGYQTVDFGNGDGPQPYYTQGDKGTQSLNDTYEWSKLQAARSLPMQEDFTNTGTDYTVNNGTILGQSQSFTNFAVAQKLTEARFSVKRTLSPSGNLYAELYASAAGIIPTGAALATSEEVLGSLITTSYQEVIFRFNDNVTLNASTQYTIVIRSTAAGDGSNFYQVQGAATGNTAGQNKAEDTGSWAAQAAADLYHSVKASPILHGYAGELHRGPNLEIAYDAEASGPFDEANNEVIYWGTEITYDGLASGPWVVGDYVQFQPSGGGAVKNGGKILADTGTVLTVALETITGNLLDNDIISSASGAATTANINGTPATGTPSGQNLAGGEGRLLALNDGGTTGTVWLQTFHGSSPVNNQQINGRTSGANALVNVTVTSRPVSSVWLGQSTGSNLIGAYGVGFDPADVTNNDLFFDLTNTSRTPPANVTFSVTGLVAGEDRVLVGNRVAGALNLTQFTTDTTLSTNAETVVSLAAVAVPTDTPAVGAGTSNTRLRVERDNGVYWRVPYSSYDALTPGNFTIDLPDTGAGGIRIDVDAPSGTFTRVVGSFLDDGFEEGHRFTGSGFTNGGNNATFTAASISADGLSLVVVDNTGMVTENNAAGGTDERLLATGMDFSEVSQGGNATSGNNAFIGYIDTLAAAPSESFTAIYSADRDLIVRVRDGGGTPIKTFQGNAVFGDANSSIAAIRTSDA